MYMYICTDIRIKVCSSGKNCYKATRVSNIKLYFEVIGSLYISLLLRILTLIKKNKLRRQGIRYIL